VAVPEPDDVEAPVGELHALVGAVERRAGAERGRDAAEQVGRDGALADGGAAAGLPGAQDRRDLGGDVVVGGDPGEGASLRSSSTSTSSSRGRSRASPASASAWRPRRARASVRARTSDR
jgi:hypothetical protein